MDEQKKTPKNTKLGFLGDSNVWKTSICTTYVGIEFTEDTLTTIGLDKFDSKISLNDGNKIKLFLWDTSGQERFRSSAFRAMRVVHGIILVFDLTSRQTFENIDKWLNDIRDNFDRPFLVLFGNKADKEKEKREVIKWRNRRICWKKWFNVFWNLCKDWTRNKWRIILYSKQSLW